MTLRSSILLFIMKIQLCFTFWESEPVLDCWEECFHEGEYNDREAYQIFYEFSQFLRMTRMIDNLNGTFIVLDSSLVEEEDVDVFRYLKDVIKLIAFTNPVGSLINPLQIAQFNQDFAW